MQRPSPMLNGSYDYDYDYDYDYNYNQHTRRVSS